MIGEAFCNGCIPACIPLHACALLDLTPRCSILLHLIVIKSVRFPEMTRLTSTVRSNVSKPPVEKAQSWQRQRGWALKSRQRIRKVGAVIGYSSIVLGGFHTVSLSTLLRKPSLRIPKPALKLPLRNRRKPNFTGMPRNFIQASLSRSHLC